MKIFKALLNWVWPHYYVTPHLCPTCKANLRKQKGAYRGNGLKAERAYYKCKCGTESAWVQYSSGPDRTLWREITHLRGRNMKRIIRNRHLTAEEVAKYNTVRQQIEQEKPEINARIRDRMKKAKDLEGDFSTLEAFAKRESQ